MGKSCGAVRPGADRLSYPFMYVEGRVKVLAQYRKGEAEDLVKIRRCLQMIIDIETENTTNGKDNTEEAARRDKVLQGS